MIEKMVCSSPLRNFFLVLPDVAMFGLLAEIIASFKICLLLLILCSHTDAYNEMTLQMRVHRANPPLKPTVPLLSHTFAGRFKEV